MKKTILLLAMLVLLAKVPTTEWNKIPDKEEFLRLLGAVFCEQTECLKAVVGAMEMGDNVLFFGDCLQEGAERGKRTEL